MQKKIVQNQNLFIFIFECAVARRVWRNRIKGAAVAGPGVGAQA
jgi:hypothetical protein